MTRDRTGRPAAGRIKLFVSDVDGTLTTKDKRLTDASIAAVKSLGAAGVAFAIVSSRPPRGMRHVAGPLGVKLYGGFNGGMIVDGDGKLVEKHPVPEEAARLAIDMMGKAGADIWVFNGDDWFVTHPDGPYVARETKTVQFAPTTVANFDGHLDAVGKVVGSSTDFDALQTLEGEVRAALGDTAAARRSQLYYLDITSPVADKGYAVRAFARHYGVTLDEVAVIGDMANDEPMFDIAGFAVAMGNALPDVQDRADAVTTSNEDEGFANAVSKLILPRA